MEDDVIHNVMSKRGCHLGMVPELAAARNSSTLLTLDHDLGTSPEVGRRLTVASPGTWRTWPAVCGRPVDQRRFTPNPGPRYR
jgi:hypothetical protein